MVGWVVDVIRAFGADIWSACANYLGTLGAREAHLLLEALNLSRDDDAAFLSVHLKWFGAAVAEMLPAGAPTQAADHTSLLLGDRSWPVRERTLRGLMASDDDSLVSTAIAFTVHDPAWRSCPSGVATQLARLWLLADVDATRLTSTKRHSAQHFSRCYARCALSAFLCPP